jgi:hypothetical protein
VCVCVCVCVMPNFVCTLRSEVGKVAKGTGRERRHCSASWCRLSISLFGIVHFSILVQERSEPIFVFVSLVLGGQSRFSTFFAQSVKLTVRGSCHMHA